MLQGVIIKLGLSEKIIELLEYGNDFDSLQVVARNSFTGEIGKFVLPLSFDVPNAYDWEIVDFVTEKRFTENASRYFARKLGVDKCLKDPCVEFDYEKFGVEQEGLHYYGLVVASKVVGEWIILDDEIGDCIS